MILAADGLIPDAMIDLPLICKTVCQLRNNKEIEHRVRSSWKEAISHMILGLVKG